MKTPRGVPKSYGNYKWRKQGLNPKLPGPKAPPLSIIPPLPMTNLEMKKPEQKRLTSLSLHCMWSNGSVKCRESAYLIPSSFHLNHTSPERA